MLSAAASEADWAGTVSLACAMSAVSVALGVHPWFVGEWCDGLRDRLTHRVEHTPEIVAIGTSSWLVPGTMRRDDLDEQLGVVLDDATSEADTVSGWLVDRLGRLLAVGDVVVTSVGWRLEVRSLEGRRAGRISLRSPGTQPGWSGSILGPSDPSDPSPGDVGPPGTGPARFGS
jgi:hypothetical protein